jgi:enterochelin esterase-like enzyme
MNTPPRFRHAVLAVALALGACATMPAPVPPASTQLAPVDAPLPAPQEFRIDAPAFAPEQVTISVHLPPGYNAASERQYPVLYVNDGQDMPAVRLRETLQALYRERAIRPVIVVAIRMLPDRMGTYGLSDRARAQSVVAPTKYGPVGQRAHEYSEWVARTLVPWIDARYRTKPTPDARAILGWSLGALNAFGLGWQYPEVFGRVGAFSPSFWLSSETGDADAVQRTRLAQRLLDGTPPRNGPRMFFAVGTDEETDDRDGDGVNDAVDDTRDLIEGWRGAGVERKGLRQQGYTINLAHAVRPARTDVALYELDGGRHHQESWARMLPVFLRWAYAVHAPAIDATGMLESWQDLPSRHVAARTVDVWLPPGYADNPSKRYPVLYMHDGQNLFDPSLSFYTRTDWGVDEAMTRLIAEGRVREAIVVGVWNTPQRLQEYMPRKPVTGASLPIGVEGMDELPAEGIVSDRYLAFLVEELKPFIDATYRTRRGRDDTFVMGSSMGGLISLYAAAEYPQVFGGVGAVSTHWPIGNGVVVDWLGAHLPDPRTHRLYFDHGTATLDAQYAPYQQRVDALVRARGYVEGRNFMTRVFKGAEHSERAWRQRVDVPLEFLLRK